MAPVHQQPLHDAAAAARWMRERVRGSLHSDSRALQPGDGFIAWPGQRHDARRFVPAALQAGAAACIVEAQGIEAFDFDDERIAALPHLSTQAGTLADAFFDQPSRALDLLAITGTNGKTSTSWWLAHALALRGRRCAVIGTLGAGEPAGLSGAQYATGLQATGLTTPDAVALQRVLRSMVDDGVRACAIEASSIGLQQQRLAGCHIRVALFSNLTQDHLDHHRTMAAYWAAKRALFDWPGLQAAVVNIDDAHGHRLADELRGTPLSLWTCSMQAGAADGAARHLRADAIRHEPAGLAFELYEGARTCAVHSRLIGEFNVANLLLVVGGLRALGIALDEAVGTLAWLQPVPGRMQRVRGSDSGTTQAPDVVVDYAHTPDALDKALQALRPFAATRGGRLWCVFGCGGNRDAGKRAPMGAVAQRLADQVVLTSDNPRDERPAEILAQIAAGMKAGMPPLIIEDRRSAIVYALRHARAADVVLLAGKGHETTQEIGGHKRTFSDVAEAEAALRQRAGGGS